MESATATQNTEPAPLKVEPLATTAESDNDADSVLEIETTTAGD